MDESPHSIWANDMLAGAITLLTEANRLWDQQCFTKPTAARTAQIDSLLSDAQRRIAKIRCAIS